MPELPEVEVTRLSFAERIVGAQIQNVSLGKPLRWPLGCLPKDLLGLTVKRVTRRGKYLLIEMDPSVLLMHLGMSGSLRFETSPQTLLQTRLHDHFVLRTSKGTLTLNDPRRFGAVVFAPSLDSPVVTKLLGHLGVEPLGEEFTPELLYKALRQRRVNIKQALLGGQIVVGVGNIYASESLFIAGIRPTKSSAKLTKAQSALLYTAICETLGRAIAVGGSTLQNFSNAMGESGYFQLESYVYGRAGQACRRCQTPIKQIVQGQRSTFYCPVCQK
jgi:formamidopyrimidine-DNA glycosylase